MSSLLGPFNQLLAHSGDSYPPLAAVGSMALVPSLPCPLHVSPFFLPSSVHREAYQHVAHTDAEPQNHGVGSGNHGWR